MVKNFIKDNIVTISNENIGVEIESTKHILFNPVNLRWANEEHTRIDMTIQHSEFGEIEFSAHENDIEFHGRKLFELCKDNDNIAKFDPFYWNPESPENPANQIDVLITEDKEEV
jgi:hypothetical protein